jgi:hypothetical protein
MKTSIEVTISEVEAGFIVTVKNLLTDSETVSTFNSKTDLICFLKGFYL